MRGTIAKRLRREAQEQSVGKDAKKLGWNKRTGAVQHFPSTTRAVYQRLKAAFYRLQRSGAR